MNIKQTLETIKKNERKIGAINQLVEEFKKFVQQADKKREKLAEMNYLLNDKTMVRAGFGDFISELAKSWKCDLKDVRYEIVFCDHTLKPRQYSKEILCGMFDGTIFRVNFRNMKGEEVVSISQRIDTKALQADGKSMADHLMFGYNEKDNGDRVYCPRFDYVKDFVLQLPLGDLVYVDFKGHVHHSVPWQRIMLEIALADEKQAEENEERKGEEDESKI